MHDTLNILVKSGNICNLECLYCFDDCSGSPKRFSLEGLSILMKQLSCLPYRRLIFAWHGGEPLTAGISYFKDVLKIQEQFQDKHQEIYNSLHTNGVLIDQEWIDFFVTNHFSIGIGLDGPKDFNDAMRRFKSGTGTFDQVCDSMRLLRVSGLGLNMSVTVREDSWKIVDELYNLCKTLDVDSIEFWPLLHHYHNNLSETKSVSVNAYIKFVKRLLSGLWFEDEKAGVWHPHIYLFEDLIASDKKPNLCWFNRKNCLSNIMIDVNGNVYPCDSFQGYNSMRMGNFYETDLKTIFSDTIYHNYMKGVQKLPEICLDCKWMEICSGGCPYQRYLSNEYLTKPSRYCSVNKLIFGLMGYKFKT